MGSAAANPVNRGKPASLGPPVTRGAPRRGHCPWRPRASCLPMVTARRAGADQQCGRRRAPGCRRPDGSALRLGSTGFPLGPLLGNPDDANRRTRRKGNLLRCGIECPSDSDNIAGTMLPFSHNECPAERSARCITRAVGRRTKLPVRVVKPSGGQPRPSLSFRIRLQ